MPYHIREALFDDAEGISRLISVLGYAQDAATTNERLRVYDGDPFSSVFVACNDAGLVGFLSFHAIPLFHEAGRLGRITAMAIDAEHQRKGVGTLLLKAAEGFAVSAGCTRIEVTSGDRREQDAHVFYAAQGYVSDCRRFLKRF